MRRVRRSVAILIVVFCCAGCTGSMSPTATSSRTDDASSASSPTELPSEIESRAPPATAATTTWTPATMPPAPDIQRYLALARAAFPQRTDAELVDLARTVCTELDTNASTHDAVGNLAAKLGTQTQAQR